jgi:hypothetical protein
VERPVLDVDALVHARRPGLVPEIEALIRALPDGAHMERAVRMEAVRSSLGQLLDAWQSAGLLYTGRFYRDAESSRRRTVDPRDRRRHQG